MSYERGASAVRPYCPALLSAVFDSGCATPATGIRVQIESSVGPMVVLGGVDVSYERGASAVRPYCPALRSAVFDSGCATPDGDMHPVTYYMSRREIGSARTRAPTYRRRKTSISTFLSRRTLWNVLEDATQIYRNLRPYCPALLSAVFDSGCATPVQGYLAHKKQGTSLIRKNCAGVPRS